MYKNISVASYTKYHKEKVQKYRNSHLLKPLFTCFYM